LAAGPLFGAGHSLGDRLRLPYTQPADVLRRAVALLAQADVDAQSYRVPTGAVVRRAADPVV
jgi:hypothetical protein